MRAGRNWFLWEMSCSVQHAATFHSPSVYLSMCWWLVCLMSTGHVYLCLSDLAVFCVCIYVSVSKSHRRNRQISLATSLAKGLSTITENIFNLGNLGIGVVGFSQFQITHIQNVHLSCIFLGCWYAGWLFEAGCLFEAFPSLPPIVSMDDCWF